MAIPMTRLSTSKAVLDLDWHFPVAHKFEATKRDDKQTSAAFVERALPRTEAFYKINGTGNRKPLLVLRECTLCKGTDHALFDRRLNNEKTQLLCHWFYCVKLPPKVMAANHPFRHVFVEKHPPHLFISSFDGKNVTAFSGLQTQSQLQRALIALIKDSYDKNPLPAIKSMLRFLSEFDKHDGMIELYEDRIQKEMLRDKPRKSNLKKLQLKLAATKKKRATAMRRAKAVCDLELKIVPEAKSPAKPKAAPKARRAAG